jgi:hypothetical protein
MAMQSATIQLKAPRRPVRPVERRVATPIALKHERRSWLRRWFGRREPTAYQRCLAIHIHYAGPRSALS